MTTETATSWRERIAENVERGAQLLDMYRPGWAQRVNIDRLCLTHCCNCVLGQIAGEGREYCDERDTLCAEVGADTETSSEGFAVPHGFYLTHQDLCADDSEKRWQRLDELWCEEIRTRREVEP